MPYIDTLPADPLKKRRVLAFEVAYAGGNSCVRSQ